jgi:hypothetical protein
VSTGDDIGDCNTVFSQIAVLLVSQKVQKKLRTRSGDFSDIGILIGTDGFCSGEGWVSTLTSGPGDALMRGEPIGE